MSDHLPAVCCRQHALKAAVPNSLSPLNFEEMIAAIEAEARRTALISLREKVAGILMPDSASGDQEHNDAVWQYNAGLSAVLAEIDRALGEP
jgi:hypothetical protein